MENKFYVYAHQKKTDGKCFYIGKGQGNRMYSDTGRNSQWKNIVKEHGFNPIILVNNLTEEQACKLEKSFIQQIGRENLCNMTDGGETHFGISHTEETKNKLRKPKSEQHKLNMSIGKKGLKHKPHKPHIFTEESKINMRKPKSEQHKLNMSKARKGKPNPKKFHKNTINPIPKPVTSEVYSIETIEKMQQAKTAVSKRVLQYDLEGNFIREWESLHQIHRETGYKFQAISAAINNKVKTSYGYIWKLKS